MDACWVGVVFSAQHTGVWGLDEMLSQAGKSGEGAFGLLEH